MTDNLTAWECDIQTMRQYDTTPKMTVIHTTVTAWQCKSIITLQNDSMTVKNVTMWQCDTHRYTVTMSLDDNVTLLHYDSAVWQYDSVTVLKQVCSSCVPTRATVSSPRKLLTLGKSGQWATVTTHWASTRVPPQKCFPLYWREATLKQHYILNMFCWWFSCIIAMTHRETPTGKI